LVAIVLLCGGLGLPARAEDAVSPEALRTAQELAAVMNTDTVEQTSTALATQIWPRIEAEFGGKVDSATLGEMRSVFEGSLTRFTHEMMLDTPAIYARYFSVQELRDMIAFYKSPTGAKSLQMMPKVIADVSSRMAPRMQLFQQDLVSKIQAVMQKHGYKN
jgi:hypothetical protein